MAEWVVLLVAVLHHAFQQVSTDGSERVGKEHGLTALLLMMYLCPRLLVSPHSVSRKVAMSFQFAYQVVNIAMGWFLVRV